MEKRQRMTLLGIAAAIAVAAVVIALVVGGGDDDGDSDTSNTGTQAAQTDTAGGDTTTEKPKPKPKPKVTSIKVEGGEPVGGVKEIKAKKGETVRIDVTSDQPDELHLHVYDKTKELQPGQKARLQFKATVEGVIELELHESGNQVAEITVEPS